MQDTMIIGAGPIGIACAISAKRSGHDPLLTDAGAIVNSIVNYPIGMTFFTTPELLEVGGHPLVCAGQKPTREEAMMYYRGVVRAERIRTMTHARFTGLTDGQDRLTCRFETTGGVREIDAKMVVLATGYYDNPKMMGVPGEDLAHVSHYFDEAHRNFDRDVVVIGGRNSAVEAALELFRAGARVTLVYRGTEFPPSVKYWVKPDIENRIRAGEIDARLGSDVKEITKDAVVTENADGQLETLSAQRVYALTGFLPDTDLFRKVGINIDAETGRPEHDERTLETNVSGVYVAGSIKSGYKTSDIFIENGRFDGDLIFSSEKRGRGE